MDIEQWYFGIPLVTRVFLTLSVAVSIAVSYDVVTPLNLIYSPTLVFQEKQYWRLITSLVFFDKMSISCFFHLHFLYMFSRRLEEHFYLGNSLQYLYTLVRGAAALMALSSFVHMPFPSGPLVMMILYLWSRRYPDEQMSLYFVFTVNAPYLPLMMLAISYAMSGESIHHLYVDLAGMLVGHVLWYFSDVFPKIAGFDPMVLPKFIRGMFG